MKKNCANDFMKICGLCILVLIFSGVISITNYLSYAQESNECVFDADCPDGYSCSNSGICVIEKNVVKRAQVQATPLPTTCRDFCKGKFCIQTNSSFDNGDSYGCSSSRPSCTTFLTTTQFPPNNGICDVGTCGAGGITACTCYNNQTTTSSSSSSTSTGGFQMPTPTPTPTPFSTSACGNSMIESGETCDDGNTVAGDGCSNLCQTEPCSLCFCRVADAGNRTYESIDKKLIDDEIKLIKRGKKSRHVRSYRTDSNGDILVELIDKNNSLDKIATIRFACAAPACQANADCKDKLGNQDFCQECRLLTASSTNKSCNINTSAGAGECSPNLANTCPAGHICDPAQCACICKDSNRKCTSCEVCTNNKCELKINSNCSGVPGTGVQCPRPGFPSLKICQKSNNNNRCNCGQCNNDPDCQNPIYNNNNLLKYCVFNLTAGYSTCVECTSSLDCGPGSNCINGLCTQNNPK